MLGSNFDIFERMKRFVYLLVLIPALSWAQYDFETRYFTMDAEALPEMSSFNIDFGEKNVFQKIDIRNYNQVTVENYWQPVDMVSALEKDDSMLNAPNINVPGLQQRQFGFSVSVNGNNSQDGSSSYGVKNTVYKESRGYFYCSPSGNYYARRRNTNLFNNY